jgi:Anti-sigma factor NepR
MTEKPRSTPKGRESTHKVTPVNMTQNNQNPATIAMQDLLGDKLKAYYNEVVGEPVPDRFSKLLLELETRSNPKKTD